MGKTYRIITGSILLTLTLAGIMPAETIGLPPLSGGTNSQQNQTFIETGEPLTLQRALELAARFNQQLAASAEGVLAAEADARQAGVIQNPELEFEAEEFGGSGALKGYDGAETSARLTQSFELGGKRSKRQHVAQSQARLAGWDHEATRRNVHALTRQSFVDVLLAQDKLVLEESMLGIAGDIQKAVEKRVKSGKVASLEETRAGIEVATARIARDRARLELDTARKRLASLWGETTPAFKEAGGELDAVGDLPTLENFSAILVNNPEVARWDEEVAIAEESLALAKATRIPDVSISAGIKRLEEDGMYAGIAGLSLPLPLFDRNSAGIASARHQALRAEYEQRAALLRAATDLAEAYNRLETARAEAVAIRDELLPGALQAFNSAQTGYQAGKFGYLEVLDTQRTLNETRANYLDVLASYHKAAAEVERVSGIPLNTF